MGGRERFMAMMRQIRHCDFSNILAIYKSKGKQTSEKRFAGCGDGISNDTFVTTTFQTVYFCCGQPLSAKSPHVVYPLHQKYLIT